MKYSLVDLLKTTTTTFVSCTALPNILWVCPYLPGFIRVVQLPGVCVRKENDPAVARVSRGSPVIERNHTWCKYQWYITLNLVINLFTFGYNPYWPQHIQTYLFVVHYLFYSRARQLLRHMVYVTFRANSAYSHIRFTFHELTRPPDLHHTRNLKESRHKPRPFIYMERQGWSHQWIISGNAPLPAHPIMMTRDCHIYRPKLRSRKINALCTERASKTIT